MSLELIIHIFKRLRKLFAHLKYSILKSEFQIPHHIFGQHLLNKSCKHIKIIILLEYKTVDLSCKIMYFTSFDTVVSIFILYDIIWIAPILPRCKEVKIFFVFLIIFVVIIVKVMRKNCTKNTWKVIKPRSWPL